MPDYTARDIADAIMRAETARRAYDEEGQNVPDIRPIPNLPSQPTEQDLLFNKLQPGSEWSKQLMQQMLGNLGRGRT